MANQKKNYGMEGASGKIGNVVYKQKDGKMIMASKPRPSEKSSVKQEKQRRQFLKASIYAKNAMNDPELYAAYSALVRPGRGAHSFAMEDFLNPPSFAEDDTNTDEYFGRVGDIITIGVRDEFKVTSVQATIRNASGELIETGPLRVQTLNSLNWDYTVATAHDPSSCQITITAKDRPGNRTSLVLNT